MSEWGLEVRSCSARGDIDARSDAMGSKRGLSHRFGRLDRTGASWTENCIDPPRTLVRMSRSSEMAASVSLVRRVLPL